MDENKLTIYFTSDLHGYIYPTDYRGQGEKELGLFKCASRFRKDGNTLVIDGGDILQGSPLGAFCHDTIGSAARFAEMMNRCGYDYVTLGNHDFISRPTASTLPATPSCGWFRPTSPATATSTHWSTGWATSRRRPPVLPPRF